MTLALVAVLLVVYRITISAPSDELSPEARVTEILSDGGCLSCHSTDGHRPFYADFPLIGGMIQADIDEGYRAFDIAPLMAALEAGEMPNPVDVAKVERVAATGTMPAAKYYLVHWGSQMTDAKGDIVVDWARNYRSSYYNDGLEGDRAGEPIRPIIAPEGLDMAKVELGNRLFHDTRLSVNNTVSCATCHGLTTGGVDNHQYSDGVEGRMGGVNAPTVYNAVYNFVQFWDGRAVTLAEQAAGPPLNPVEMASPSFDDFVQNDNSDYTPDVNQDNQQNVQQNNTQTDNSPQSADPTQWTIAQIVETYKHAAARTHNSVTSHQIMSLRDDSLKAPGIDATLLSAYKELCE